MATRYLEVAFEPRGVTNLTHDDCQEPWRLCCSPDFRSLLARLMLSNPYGVSPEFEMISVKTRTRALMIVRVKGISNHKSEQWGRMLVTILLFALQSKVWKSST